jgi:hypothetical protein
MGKKLGRASHRRPGTPSASNRYSGRSDQQSWTELDAGHRITTRPAYRHRRSPRTSCSQSKRAWAATPVNRPGPAHAPTGQIWFTGFKNGHQQTPLGRMQTMITQGDFHRVAIVGFQEVPQRLITDMQPNRTGGPKGVTASVLSDYSLFRIRPEGGKNGTERSPSLPLSRLKSFHRQRMGLGSI